MRSRSSALYNKISHDHFFPKSPLLIIIPFDVSQHNQLTKHRLIKFTLFGAHSELLGADQSNVAAVVAASMWERSLQSVNGQVCVSEGNAASFFRTED